MEIIHSVLYILLCSNVALHVNSMEQNVSKTKDNTIYRTKELDTSTGSYTDSFIQPLKQNSNPNNSHLVKHFQFLFGDRKSTMEILTSTADINGRFHNDVPARDESDDINDEIPRDFEAVGVQPIAPTDVSNGPLLRKTPYRWRWFESLKTFNDGQKSGGIDGGRDSVARVDKPISPTDVSDVSNGPLLRKTPYRWRWFESLKTFNDGQKSGGIDGGRDSVARVDKPISPTDVSDGSVRRTAVNLWRLLGTKNTLKGMMQTQPERVSVQIGVKLPSLGHDLTSSSLGHGVISQPPSPGHGLTSLSPGHGLISQPLSLGHDLILPSSGHSLISKPPSLAHDQISSSPGYGLIPPSPGHGLISQPPSLAHDLISSSRRYGLISQPPSPRHGLISQPPSPRHGPISPSPGHGLISQPPSLGHDLISPSPGHGLISQPPSLGHDLISSSLRYDLISPSLKHSLISPTSSGVGSVVSPLPKKSEMINNVHSADSPNDIFSKFRTIGTAPTPTNHDENDQKTVMIMFDQNGVLHEHFKVSMSPKRRKND